MKKLLSIVLSLVMVMTMLPTFAITAFAGGTVNVTAIYSNNTKGATAQWDEYPGASEYFYMLENTTEAGEWRQCSGITGYTKKSGDVLECHYGGFSDYGNGGDKYRVRVTAYDSNDVQIAIGYSDVFETGYQILPTPESITLNEDGKVSCTKVTNANKYFFFMYEVTSDENYGSSNNVIGLETTSPSCDFGPHLTKGTKYRAAVYVLGDWQKYRNSKKLYSKNIITGNGMEKEAITGIKWEGTTLKWNKYPNANTYYLSIRKKDNTGKFVQTGSWTKTTDTSINLSGYFSKLGPGEYKIFIQATGLSERHEISLDSESPTYDYGNTISNVIIGGSINTGDYLNDSGPLRFVSCNEPAIQGASFTYTKDGKLLADNTKATFGNYGCTVSLVATGNYKFTNTSIITYNGVSYHPYDILDGGEYALFEIPNIYVECNHTSSVWLNDVDNHWKMCSVCKGKFAESTHDFVEQISGSTITFTCRVCGYQKTGKVAETRTAIYRPYIDFGTAMVGDAIPTTVKLDYANLRSGSEKYYNYATVQSVNYSTTGTFKNAKTTVTVVLKANEDYYFESIALPTPVSSCYLQYTRDSVNVSEDGTTLTAVFSFTPYTSSDVTLTLPEFVSGKTYAEIAKEVQFKVNGVVAKDYSFSIRKAGESSWTISNISDGVVSGQYMYESVIEPNTEYEFGVNSNINRTYAKSLTITNPNVAVITDSYYGEAEARVNANYTSIEGHNYDAGTITKQATCTEDGSITFKCTDTGCKSTKTMVIPAKGHQASTAYEIPATCIEEGKTAGTVCSRCDTVLSGRTPIKPTGEHYYSVQLAPEVKPTCNADGKTAIMQCGNCDARIGGEVIKPTGKHTAGTPVKENVVAATSGKAGSYDEVTYCTGCKTEMSRVKKTTPPANQYILGDANSDGVINAKDVLLLRKYLAKYNNLVINLSAADCNEDGKVDAKDVLLLRKYLAKWNVTLGKAK